MQPTVVAHRVSQTSSRLAESARGMGLEWLQYSYRKAGLRGAKLGMLLWRSQRTYAALRARTPSEPSRAEQCVVILPTDPVLLTSSLGDDAMYASTLRAVEQRLPGARIYVLTMSAQADAAAQARGMTPLRVTSLNQLVECQAVIRAIAPRHLVLLGADGIDGAHDPNFSFGLLANADLAARAGIPTTITGFSTSLRADRRLKNPFDDLHASLRVYVRDPVSLKRFRRSFRAHAELLADPAFLLEPTLKHARVNELVAWAEQRREAGDIVLGLNVHPLLYQGWSESAITAHAQTFARELVEALRSDVSLSVMLIAHDFRGSSADAICHRAIAPALRSASVAAFEDLEQSLSASDIKGLVGALDGVITGRMHLAIAALGRGTPVLGLNYRDKMEGLAELFEQTHAVVSNDEYHAVRPAVDKARAFVAQLAQHRAVVRKNRERVVALAHKNFESLSAAPPSE